MEAEYDEPDRNGRDPHVTSRSSDWPSERPSREVETASGLNIFQAMWNHWLLLIVCVTIGGGLGYLHFLRTEPVYASSARIRLIQSSPVINLEGLSDVVRSRDPLDTHAVLIRSPIIVQRAVQTHALDDVLGPGAEHVITAGLAVSRNSQSKEILDLSFSCDDPHLCQKVLSSLIAAYVDYLGDSQQSTAQRTLQLITEAKDELLQELVEKETAYEVFRDEASLLWSGDEATNVHTQRLADIESRRSQAILERTMIESRLTSLRTLVDQGKSREAILLMIDQFGSEDGPVDGEARPTTLAQQVVPLVLEKALLLEKLGPGHPKVREVQKRIELTRSLLEQQRAGEAAMATKPQKDLITVYMESLQHEIDSQDAQIRQLTDLFEQEAVAARKLLAEENRNRTLREDISRTKQLFEAVLAKLQAAELTKETGTLSAEAVVPPAPGRKVAPIMSRSVAIGGVLGLLAALGLVALLELSHRSYRTPGEISRHLGVPVIGQIPVIDTAFEKRAIRHGLAADPLLVSLNRPGSSIAESYRGVRTALTMGVGGNHKLIQITSANPADGKSTLSANLAITLARSGKRCLLMDCDFRRPSVHRLFGVPSDVGVSTTLEQRTEWPEAVQQGPLATLDLLTCGPRVSNPAELLLSPQFADLLRVVRDRYDVVIIDSPPILAVSEPSTIAAMVDGVVLVTGFGRNARALMTRTQEALEVVGARLLGVVVNAVGRSSSYGRGYRRYQSYPYRDSRPADPPPSRESANDPETAQV